ncbi:MFS transporter [Agromyces intestinalis]|uniref:MFS transporter n=1 Tax=Agromyces intestinalis TaxID=2592652 RepID=A0A5C1YKP2_9MICO|nr:MFS transporter [Agromyces intestinalis]QEO15637.1 MFS transporter [Agromyces intestinalis]
MSSTVPPFTWRSIILPAYLPTFVYSIGEGAIIPVIPVIATDRGASLALAGLVAAMVMVGELCGDLPAGWLVAKVGERAAMLAATALTLGATLLAVLVPTVWALGVGVFLIGFASAVFGLARHAFLTSYVPSRVRARALSTLAGVFRGGWAVGPFVAAALLTWTGHANGVFWVLVGACTLVAVILLVLPDPERVFGAVRLAREASGLTATGSVARVAGGTDASGTTDAPPPGVFRTMVQHRGVLARIGTGAGIIAAVRASRVVILPLWAVSIGMPPEQAAVVIGLSATIDFALFYTSGQVMDRFGRLWGAIPGLIGLAAGHLMLALTHDAPGAATWFTIAGLLLGVSNGLTSGILMTLGADLAPKRHPAPFLGAFRTIADAGAAAAPLAIAAVTSAVSIAAASAGIGVLGLVGAAMLARWVPRYVPHRARG